MPRKPKGKKQGAVKPNEASPNDKVAQKPSKASTVKQNNGNQGKPVTDNGSQIESGAKPGSKRKAPESAQVTREQKRRKGANAQDNQKKATPEKKKQTSPVLPLNPKKRLEFDEAQVTKAVTSMKEQLLKKDQESKQSSENDTSIKLSICLIKDAGGKQHSGNKLFRVPHFFRDLGNLCFFVKDPKEESVKIIEKKIIPGNKKFISPQELKSDYATFDLRKKLAKSSDTFFFDMRLKSAIRHLLGKSFLKCQRIYPLQLTDDDWPDKITALKQTADIEFSNGKHTSVKLGVASQSAEDIANNMNTFLKAIQNYVPGGVDNIHRISVEAANVSQFPIYTSAIPEEKITTLAKQNSKTGIAAKKGAAATTNEKKQPQQNQKKDETKGEGAAAEGKKKKKNKKKAAQNNEGKKDDKPEATKKEATEGKKEPQAEASPNTKKAVQQKESPKQPESATQNKAQQKPPQNQQQTQKSPNNQNKPQPTQQKGKGKPSDNAAEVSAPKAAPVANKENSSKKESPKGKPQNQAQKPQKPAKVEPEPVDDEVEDDDGDLSEPDDDDDDDGDERGGNRGGNRGRGFSRGGGRGGRGQSGDRGRGRGGRGGRGGGRGQSGDRGRGRGGNRGGSRGRGGNRGGGRK